MLNRWFKQLLRYIFVGALSLFPLVLVLIVVNFLKDLGISAYFSLNHYTDSFGITMGLMAMVGVLFAVLGYSIEKYGKSLIISVIDRIFDYVPAIRTVYSVSKKLANMLSGNDESGKKEVVLLEYPKADVWVAAYLLNRHKGVCVLFIPTSPNPTSGYTVIVKETLVVSTSLSLEEASSFIISMGADFVKKDELAQIIQNHQA
ncbi:MAG: DUF502 domain-containing protein [Helicobacteraceae bacterium]|jgi:uncharacterized membrane protein|nr:DUF502 domain-containing protein [Helicobacteraceae bacterium]